MTPGGGNKTSTIVRPNKGVGNKTKNMRAACALMVHLLIGPIFTISAPVLFINELIVTATASSGYLVSTAEDRGTPSNGRQRSTTIDAGVDAHAPGVLGSSSSGSSSSSRPVDDASASSQRGLGQRLQETMASGLNTLQFLQMPCKKGKRYNNEDGSSSSSAAKKPRKTTSTLDEQEHYDADEQREIMGENVPTFDDRHTAPATSTTANAPQDQAEADLQPQPQQGSQNSEQDQEITAEEVLRELPPAQARMVAEFLPRNH